MYVNSDRARNIIAVTSVLMQVILVISQIILIDVYGIDEDKTTTYRVLLAAVPILLACALTFKKRPLLWISTYFVLLIIFFLHSIIFPPNLEYIFSEGLKFTLPIVVPCALVLISVNDIKIIDGVMYCISWVCFIFILFYLLCFFKGIFIIDTYSMSLSYGSLLPALTLYSRNNWYSKVASLIILLTIISIGSRGAAIFIALYYFIDMFLFNKNMRVLGVLFIILFFMLFSNIVSVLENIGISSRTLTLLLNSELLSHDSGRNEIYSAAESLIKNNYILGVGVFGDRVHLGEYPHNIIYEVVLDFGIIIGGLLVLVFGYKCITIFFKLSKESKEIFIRYFLSGVVPLMVSGSYLKHTAFGFFIGILVILQHNLKYRSVYGKRN